MPVNVIQNFLEDVRRHGRYTGVCGLGVRLQGLESGPLRLKPRVGLRVTEVAPLAPAASLQRENDIVVRIDGIEVMKYTIMVGRLSNS